MARGLWGGRGGRRGLLRGHELALERAEGWRIVAWVRGRHLWVRRRGQLDPALLHGPWHWVRRTLGSQLRHRHLARGRDPHHARHLASSPDRGRLPSSGQAAAAVARPEQPSVVCLSSDRIPDPDRSVRHDLGVQSTPVDQVGEQAPLSGHVHQALARLAELHPAQQRTTDPKLPANQVVERHTPGDDVPPRCPRRHRLLVIALDASSAPFLDQRDLAQGTGMIGNSPLRPRSSDPRRYRARRPP